MSEIPDELRLLHGLTATQRHKEGVDARYTELRHRHEAHVAQALQSDIAEFMTSANRLIGDARIREVRQELESIDASIAVPNAEMVASWIECDAFIWSLEAKRCRVGYMWGTAETWKAGASWGVELLDAQLRMVTLCDKDSEISAQNRILLTDPLIKLLEVETHCSRCKRVYERLTALIDSLQRLAQRRFVQTRYIRDADVVEKAKEE